MDFFESLNQHGDQLISSALRLALEHFFETCSNQLKIDVGERTLASRLADCMRPHFAELEVEVEYNRMGDAPKTLQRDGEPERVFPDIIVHKAMTNEANLLVIELKKSTNPQLKDEDVWKLQAFKADLNYQHALFLRLGVQEQAGTISEYEWV